MSAFYNPTPTNFYDDYISHYGVVGMKWGIRRDLKRTGSISKKTKNKINEAASKASYRKTRRMLNAAESLKSDYRGSKEKYRSRGDNAKANKASKSSDEVSKISNDIKKTAKNKNYEYDVAKNVMRSTTRSKSAIGIPTVVGLAAPGTVAITSIQGRRMYNKDNKYRARNNTVNSPYYTYDTDMYYSKKKKKK